MEVNIVYFLVLVAILTWIYRKATKHHGYFHEKPIPSMGRELFFGSTGLRRKIAFADFVKMIYDKYEGVKVFGLHDKDQRVFVVRDPELIKKIAVKDFDHFVDRRQVLGDDDSENSNMLLNKTLPLMKGQKWRDMRTTLSPAFTGSKMRAMIELIVDYSDQLIQIVQQEASSTGSVDHEMRDFFSRIATDIIATCAFGLQVESIEKRENEFYVMGKQLMNFTKLSVLARVIAFRWFPRLMCKLDVDVVDKESLQYLSKIIKETVNVREAQSIVRPDMIQLLMQARKGTLKHQQDVPESNIEFATIEESNVGKSSTVKPISEQELIAQCIMFFLAGFDTTATQFMFTAYELAINQDVQQKLYEEVVETNKKLSGKPLTYDVLQTMDYMDMVVSESLRMWSAPAIDRICVRDYNLDDGEGLRFTIDKDTCVWFPVYGIHRDPKYYPNPNKFDPERFSEANRGNIDPAAYLPFGVGPRHCIGSRLALMKIKTIMYKLLLNFSFECNEQTQVPLKLARSFVGVVTEKGVHVTLRLRT